MPAVRPQKTNFRGQPAFLAGPDQPDERQEHHGDGLDRDGQRHQDDSEHDAPGGAVIEPGQREADHQGVVVDAGDEVGEEQRVGRGQPERTVRIDAMKLGEFGHVDDAQHHAGQRRQPEQHDAGFGVDVGGPDHELLNPQEQLAVRHRRFGPHLVGAELEVVGQRRDAVLVGVEALHHQAALADVGVHVPAEQRDAEHHRQAPRRDRLQGGLAGLRPQTRTRWPSRSQARTRSMPPTASSTMDRATPMASVRIQMNSGTRRSSETGASQPTPSDPMAMNTEPMKPERRGDEGLSTSAAAGPGNDRRPSPPLQAQAPSSQDRPICCGSCFRPVGSRSDRPDAGLQQATERAPPRTRNPSIGRFSGSETVGWSGAYN